MAKKFFQKIGSGIKKTVTPITSTIVQLDQLTGGVVRYLDPRLNMFISGIKLTDDLLKGQASVESFVQAGFSAIPGGTTLKQKAIKFGTEQLVTGVGEALLEDKKSLSDIALDKITKTSKFVVLEGAREGILGEHGKTMAQQGRKLGGSRSASSTQARLQNLSRLEQNIMSVEQNPSLILPA